MEPLTVDRLPSAASAGRRPHGRLVRSMVPQSTGDYCCKRGMDLVFTTLLLLVLLPLLLLIAVLIKLDSPGPVIFVQERVGARRRSRKGHTAWEVVTFRCYKFRSMFRDASETLHEAH